MIQRLYTVIKGRYMGQGIIVCQQVDDGFSAILWPSARILRVSEQQLEDNLFCELLDTLPNDVFEPYKKAHDEILSQSKNEHPTN